MAREADSKFLWGQGGVNREGNSNVKEEAEVGQIETGVVPRRVVEGASLDCLLWLWATGKRKEEEERRAVWEWKSHL